MKAKHLLAWFPMIPIAIGNGLIREAFFKEPLGDLGAHQLSTLTAMLLFGIYIWILVRAWKPASGREARSIGLLWLCLTVAFEFLFGHFVVGHPWEALLHDYNVLEGRLWSLVLLWLAFAPYLFYRLQASTAASRP